MFDRTHIGWLISDDEVAARRRGHDPDRPDPVDEQPRRDLLGELLGGRWVDDDPPTAPR